MSTREEQMQAIAHAVKIAKSRLKELDSKKRLKTMTRPEQFERDMTVETIRKGRAILQENNYERNY